MRGFQNKPIPANRILDRGHYVLYAAALHWPLKRAMISWCSSFGPQRHVIFIVGDVPFFFLLYIPLLAPLDAAPSEVLGLVYGVVSRREGRILNEEVHVNPRMSANPRLTAASRQSSRELPLKKLLVFCKRNEKSRIL
jgi:hypothetical protein